VNLLDWWAKKYLSDVVALGTMRSYASEIRLIRSLNGVRGTQSDR